MESTTYTLGGRVYIVRRTSSQLQHHGVKGMKWGVRKKRNTSSSQSDGAERSAKTRKAAKRVAAALVMTATAAAAVYAYKKNPELVKSTLSKVGNTTIEGAKKVGSKSYEAGKKYVQNAAKGAKEGIKEGIKEGFQNAPKAAARKATEAVITGATMMAVKRMLDSTVGKEEAARIFQANNNKKIGSFWKVSPDDRDDD